MNERMAKGCGVSTEIALCCNLLVIMKWIIYVGGKLSWADDRRWLSACLLKGNYVYMKWDGAERSNQSQPVKGSRVDCIDSVWKWDFQIYISQGFLWDLKKKQTKNISSEEMDCIEPTDHDDQISKIE